jgi:hypothetical protein
MENTRVISLLRTFSEAEVKEFHWWLQSPLHCSDKKLLLLFEACTKTWKKDRRDVPRDKAVFAQLFGAKKFNGASFRNLVSDLLFCAEEFVAWKNFGKKSWLKLSMLLDEYNSRKLPQHFESRFKQIEKFSAKESLPAFDRSEFILAVSEKEFAHVFSKNAMARQKVFKEYDQEKVLRSLCHLFFTRYVFYYLIGLDTERIFGQSKFAEDEKAREIVSLAGRYFPDDFLISMHIQLINYMWKPDDAITERMLKDFQSDKFLKLPEEDKKNCFTAVINSLLEQYTRGQISILPQLCALMDFALSQNSPVRNNIISGSFFMNYVFFMLQLGKPARASEFIKKYGALLDARYAESTLCLCNAHIAFHRQDFHEAKRELAKVVPDTPQRFLGTKNLLLKILVATKDWENIHAVIDSIRHKLGNEKFFSERVLLGEKNFLKFFVPLVQLASAEGRTKGRAGKILEEMEGTPYMLQREWLISLAEELQ